MESLFIQLSEVNLNKTKKIHLRLLLWSRVTYFKLFLTQSYRMAFRRFWNKMHPSYKAQFWQCDIFHAPFIWKNKVYLEDMESLKLNVGALVSQEVHHELQVLWFTDVPCHDCEVVSVQEQFTQQLSHITHKHVMLITGQAREDKNLCHNTYLQRLSLGHVVLRVKQFLIVIKNLEDQGQQLKNISFPKFYDKN